MTQLELKSKLQQPYHFNTWEPILKSMFNNVELFTKYQEIGQDKKLFKSGRQLGHISFGQENIALFEVEVADSINIARNRKQLRDIAAGYIDQSIVHGALVWYYSTNQSDYRLSFIQKYSEFDENGQLLKKETAPKRYTFTLGNNESCTTASMRILELRESKDKNTLADVSKAFSVDKLTKEFYRELFGWYQWALSDEIGVTYPNDRNTEKDDRIIEEHLIRLITRFIFVWFIKQKDLVPHDIFDSKYIQKILKGFDKNSIKSGNYYNAILQNLFFATLNNKIEDRDFAADGNYHENKIHYGIKTLYRYADEFCISKEELIQLFSKVPFLNGGLFECLDKSTPDSNGKIIYSDGFSRKNDRQSRAFIPNILFFEEERGLISILSRYNFTVEENSPLDVEVALDPELLGKAFENLLGTYNPETKETARKQSGSFYTPREIVQYMVDESLIEHLKRTVDKDLGNEYYKLISLENEMINLTDVQKNQIYQSLRNCKILDPACGSGAFPMGVLNRMISVIQKVLPKNSPISIYDLKLHLIENCIYGIDIQPIAAQISKLRFFISLICEQKPNSDSANNFGIKPLPNLETKFVAANSLIGLSKRNAQLELFEDPQIEVTKTDLLQVRHKHFLANTAKQKKECREEDEKLRNKLAKLLEVNGEFASEEAIQLAQWNPYDQNAISPFFDTEWMFGLKNGFDIVLGNPPYISTKGVTADDKKIYEKQYGFADDTYNHFFFQGCNLLSDKGTLSFITPKTFWTTQTKRNLRDLLLSKQINYIFDTANPFEAAMVDTCIVSVSNKNANGNRIKFLDGSKDLNNPLCYETEQSVYLNTQNAVIFKPTKENLRIFELYGVKVKELYNTWWDKISTSKNIAKNHKALEEYRKNLKPGDIALLGCLTDGGQGLATANNGKYIAVRKSTKWAKNIIESRPKKLAEVIKIHKIKINELDEFSSVSEYIAQLNEIEIATLFDNLKEKYGRDIFGQGYLYRLIDDNEIANIDSLTSDEKENGIDTSKKYYVPYDKGDKDGNRWYLETPFAIAWSKENVRFLKTDPKARYQGYQYYFKEGFCWSNVLTTYIKCRQKQKTVHSTESMSLFSILDCVPEYYIVSILNSRLIAFYVDAFVNTTSHFTTGDAKLVPILIPTQKQLNEIKGIFERAVSIRMQQTGKILSEMDAETFLDEIQIELDDFVNNLYAVNPI